MRPIRESKIRFPKVGPPSQIDSFLQKNSGISLEQTAILFGISEKQLISDLNLIWLCGLPGYSHLELIDVSYDSGFITISNAETLNRPMRITFEEEQLYF